jgi:hypothetical protein
MNLPTSYAAVNEHCNLGLSWRMINRILQDDEVWAKLPNKKGMAVDVQPHADVCRVCDLIILDTVHEL